jgi:chloride channel protein, CIC family
MCVVMLSLPLTWVTLATLLLLSDGLAVMPLVIVAVVVGDVVSARLGSARLVPAPSPAQVRPDPGNGPGNGGPGRGTGPGTVSACGRARSTGLRHITRFG